jgi:hypothetical protein
MNRKIALTLAALALAACSPDFDPASKVDKLRVLAIKAEPPEIDPEGVATLESLVLLADPDAPRTTTVVHLACVPEPGSDAPTPCVMIANLRDPATAIAEGARQACAGGSGPGGWPAIDFVGIETCVDVTVDRTCGPATVGGVPLPPPELVVTTAVRERFDALPSGAPDRILGVQAVVLAFALEATPDELVAGAGTCAAADVGANLARLWPAREHVLAMKRVTIRGPEAYDPEPNHNPNIDKILANGVEIAATIPGGTITLDPVALGTREPYTELDAAGAPIDSKSEEWVFSWFATAGDVDELHTHEGEHDEWKVGGAPGGVPAVVAAVVRDLRGGVGWKVRKVLVTP